MKEKKVELYGVDATLKLQGVDVKEITGYNHFNYYGNTVVYNLWDKDYRQYFKGVAVCREGDVYNKEFGERLARAKAVYKMRQFKAAQYQAWFDDLEERKALVDEYTKQLKYYTEKSQESFELIKKLNGDAE